MAIVRAAVEKLMPRLSFVCSLALVLSFPLLAAAQNNQNNQQNQNSNTGQPELSSGVTGPQLGELGSLSDQMSTGFIGRGADSSFVGANQTTQNANTQGQNTNRQQTRTSQDQFSQQGNQNQQRTSQTGGYSTIVYRPAHKIAFAPPKRSSVEIDSRLNQLSQRIANRRPELSGIQFQISPDNTITLTGSVASAGDRQLAQLLAQMEPGIKGIVNELEIRTPAPAGAIPSTPAQP